MKLYYEGGNHSGWAQGFWRLQAHPGAIMAGGGVHYL